MKDQKNLFLIKEKLKQMGPEEVLRQLRDCQTDGPSVKEFLDDNQKDTACSKKKT